MQTVFPVTFPREYQLDVALLATRLSARVGLGAQGCPASPGTNCASISFESGAYVELMFFDDRKVGVAYDGVPSYFEWATIAELQELGGDIGGVEIPPEIAMTWSEYEENRSRTRRWWKLW